MKPLRIERLLQNSFNQRQSINSEEVMASGPFPQPYPDLPEPIRGLLDLALDLRFSWSHDADHLWLSLIHI